MIGELDVVLAVLIRVLGILGAVLGILCLLVVIIKIIVPDSKTGEQMRVAVLYYRPNATQQWQFYDIVSEDECPNSLEELAEKAKNKGAEAVPGVQFKVEYHYIPRPKK